MELKGLLPLIGVILGWSLKTVSEYFTQRKEDVRRYRVATFYILRAYKSLMDYERGTRYFREKRPTIDEFEPWRAILEARFRESLEVHADTTSKAVETLASVDPSLATRMDNTIKNILFMLKKDITALSKSDPETYAKLIYNQDVLVDTTLADFQTVALTLASRGGFRQKEAVARWFSERKAGTKDFMESMRENQDLLRKVVEPNSDKRWKIVTTKEKFDALKKKEEFWGLVALCRAVNELRFVQMPLLEHENDNSPAAMRAKYNSLLFSCALFVESVFLVRELNKHFWHDARVSGTGEGDKQEQGSSGVDEFRLDRTPKHTRVPL